MLGFNLRVHPILVNPDREFFRIEPKEAIDVLKEIFNVNVHFVDEDCDENEEDE